MQHGSVSTAQIAEDLYEVRLQGTFDASNQRKLDAAVTALFDRGVYQLIFNFEAALYLSSSSFSALLGYAEVVGEHGGRIVFASVPPSIHEIFELLGADAAFTFARTTTEALACFRSP